MLQIVIPALCTVVLLAWIKFIPYPAASLSALCYIPSTKHERTILITVMQLEHNNDPTKITKISCNGNMYHSPRFLLNII